jgi:hypothetical protein
MEPDAATKRTRARRGGNQQGLVGITFLGLPYSEPILLKLAYSYEQATHHRVPPRTTPSLPK